jgi:uncharacterized protein YwbE
MLKMCHNTAFADKLNRKKALYIDILTKRNIKTGKGSRVYVQLIVSL